MVRVTSEALVDLVSERNHGQLSVYTHAWPPSTNKNAYGPCLQSQLLLILAPAAQDHPAS